SRERQCRLSLRERTLHGDSRAFAPRKHAPWKQPTFRGAKGDIERGSLNVADERLATVLVVEDDPGVLRLQQVRLERAGYHVHTAMTAAEAMDKIRADGIDLL